MSFLRRLFGFLFSKGKKNAKGDQTPISTLEPFSDVHDGKPKLSTTTVFRDSKQVSVETTENKFDSRTIDQDKELEGISSSPKTGGDNNPAKAFVPVSEAVLSSSSSTGSVTTHVQSESIKDEPVETGNTLIDWNESEKADNVIDSNIPNKIQTETPHTVSPTTTDKPLIESIKPSRVISHYTMKICPKTGENMKEIEVLGEKIDVSSAGCYFDRGELARILGSKPSFLQSVGNFLTGRGNPYEAADRGAEVIMLQQEIQKSEFRLRSLRLGSPEYDLEYANLKSLNAKMQGMNR